MSAELVAKITRAAVRAQLVDLRAELAECQREAERRRMGRRARIYAELRDVLYQRLGHLYVPCSGGDAPHRPTAFAGAIYCEACGERLTDTTKLCDCPPGVGGTIEAGGPTMPGGWWRHMTCGGWIPPERREAGRT